jgi:hypothetical protein
MSEINWNNELEIALKKLVETKPPIGWDDIAAKLGISVVPCKRKAHAMGLTKKNSNPKWRLNMGLPPVNEAKTLHEARAKAKAAG